MAKKTLLIILAFCAASEAAILFSNFYLLPHQITSALQIPALPDQLTPRLADKLDRVVVIKLADKELARLPTSYLIENYQRGNSSALRFNFTLATEQLERLAATVNQPADPGRLILDEDQHRVIDFTLPQPGQAIDEAGTLANIARGILSSPAESQGDRGVNFTIEIEVELATHPTTDYSLAALGKQKSLGLNVLLATGESNFAGSPAGRTHNIKVAAEKFDGDLIPPGAGFSFVGGLGEISEAAGFQPDLTVRNHIIQAELGGGICQVATTIYRAAMLAGLPITEQRNHSLALTYYSPPGFDATVYPGVIDLKFRNDTPGWLLIKNEIVGTKLITKIYGSSDGRQVNLERPAGHYLPNGTLAVSLIRHLTLADGSNQDQEFKSLYQPASLFTHAVPVNPLE